MDVFWDLLPYGLMLVMVFVDWRFEARRRRRHKKLVDSVEVLRGVAEAAQDLLNFYRERELRRLDGVTLTSDEALAEEERFKRRAAEIKKRHGWEAE